MHDHEHSPSLSLTGAGPSGAIEAALGGAMPPLHAAENALAHLPVDLDEGLSFGTGHLLLTTQRLLARLPGASDWVAYPLTTGHSLHHHDHAGVGTLELHSATERLARWRFTLGVNVQALRFVKRFEQVQAALQSG